MTVTSIPNILEVEEVAVVLIAKLEPTVSVGVVVRTSCWSAVFIVNRLVPAAFCIWNAVVEFVWLLTMALALAELVRRLMLPVPPWMVVVLVVLVEPILTVWAAPVLLAMLTVEL